MFRTHKLTLKIFCESFREKCILISFGFEVFQMSNHLIGKNAKKMLEIFHLFFWHCFLKTFFYECGCIANTFEI